MSNSKSSFFANASKKTPDEFIKNIYDKIDRDKRKTIALTAVTAVLTCFFNYFYLMVNGYGGPDTICEGIYTYIAKDNAICSARWFTVVINFLFGKNLIFPFTIVIITSLLFAFSAFILFDLLNIKSRICQVLMVCAMVSFPVVTKMYAYLYICICYGFCFLAVTLAAFWFRKRKLWAYVLGVIFLIGMFGTYQSYLAAAATICVILFIMDLLRGRSLKDSAFDLGIYAVLGVVSGIIDMIISKAVMMLSHIATSDRITELSVKDVFIYLPETLRNCYSYIYYYFTEHVLGRSKLYPLLFAIILGLLTYSVVRLIKDKKYAAAVLVPVMFVLIPVAMNLCAIIFPHNGLSPVMKYQYVLVIPLLFALLDYVPVNLGTNLTRWISILIVFVLVSGYAITSNATQISYKIAYDSTKTTAQLMLADACDVEGFIPNVTPVIITSAIDWAPATLGNPEVFNLSEMEAGPIFWGGAYGPITCRHYYFINYLGFDAKAISQNDYLEIVTSPEFAEMPVWPKEGSCRMINGKVCIKTTEEPPLY